MFQATKLGYFSLNFPPLEHVIQHIRQKNPAGKPYSPTIC